GRIRAAGASRGARLRRRRAHQRRGRRGSLRVCRAARNRSRHQRNGSQPASIRRRAPDALQNATRGLLRALTSANRLGENSASRTAETALSLTHGHTGSRIPPQAGRTREFSVLLCEGPGTMHVVLLEVITILSGAHVVKPRPILAVPRDGLCQAILETHRRLPA